MNARWLLFAEGILAGKSATKAAQDAGYSSKSAYNQANRLMRNDEVKAYIAKRLAEKVMPANEVLERLTQHARGTFAPFLSADGTIDLNTEAAKEHIGLLKKVKVKERTYVRGETPVREVDTEIELQDQQAALVQMGRHHKLFVDRTRAETWEDDLADLVKGEQATLDDVAREFGEEIAARIAARVGVLRGQNRTVQGESGK